MARLPVLSARDVFRVLARAGFVAVGQRGSHVRFKGQVRGQVRIVVVPNHPELAKGTLLAIVRQSGLSRAQFLALL